MREAPLTLDIVVKGYRRAYFFLREEQASLKALRKAARGLGPELARQYKRMGSVAKKRTITNLERDDLFLALVIDAADEIAARDSRSGSGVILTSAAYLRLFLLHAISISREHSLPLAVAVTRVIHAYPTDVTRQLYEEVLFGSERADYGYREIKQRIMDSIDLRFKGLLKRVTGANGESRFLVMPPSDADREQATCALDLLTVWGPDHVIPGNFSAARTRLENMHGSNNPDEAHTFDRRRMHAFSDPLCFGRLVLGVPDLAPAHKTLSLPVFHLPDHPRPDADLQESDYSGETPLPEEAALLEIANIPSEQAVLRERWHGGTIQFHIDGEAVSVLHPGSRRTLRSWHAGFVSVIEIWGTCDGEEVLLARDTVKLIADDAADLEMEFALAEGMDLTIRTLVRGKSDAPVLSFCVVYGAETDFNGHGKTDVVGFHGGRTVLVIPIDLQSSKKKIEEPKTRGP